MSKYKRPFGVIAGPFLVLLALGGYWGVRAVGDMKSDVEGWAYQFEHTAEPVLMDMPDIPVFPPLIVNGHWAGRIESVKLMRSEANSLDSLAVLASVNADHLEHLEGCALRLRLRSLDVDGYSRALRCTRNTRSLQPFGHVSIEGSNMTVPIMVRPSDLEHTLSIELGHELEHLQHDLEGERAVIERELRVAAEELRVELENVKTQVRTEVRAAVREAGR